MDVSTWNLNWFSTSFDSYFLVDLLFLLPGCPGVLLVFTTYLEQIGILSNSSKIVLKNNITFDNPLEDRLYQMLVKASVDYVLVETANNNEPVEISIYNTFGQLVYTEKTADNKTKIRAFMHGNFFIPPKKTSGFCSAKA